MICLPLFKKNMLSSLKLLFIILAVMALYTCVIIYMYDPALSDMLNDYQQALPEMMSAVGMTGIATNLLEFIHIYLYGFIMFIFPMIFIIIQGNKLISHYIDNGSMACLLATPNSRRKLILTQLVSLILSITMLIVLITVIAVACSEALFPGELDTAVFLKLNGALLAFHLCLSGISYASACICSDSRWYFTFGAGIPILFFVLNMMKNMGGDLEFIRYFTIFTLFPGERIIQCESGSLAPVLVLLALGALFYTLGALCFERKDLYL